MSWLGVPRTFLLSLYSSSSLWFYRYFRALANGETPPVKERKRRELERICSIFLGLLRSGDAGGHAEDGHGIDHGTAENHASTGRLRQGL